MKLNLLNNTHTHTHTHTKSVIDMLNTNMTELRRYVAATAIMTLSLTLHHFNQLV